MAPVLHKEQERKAQVQEVGGHPAQDEKQI